MCLSVPARVISIDGKKAEVEVYSESRQVYLACERVSVGDFVLIYGGMAICLLEVDDAREIMALLNGSKLPH